MPPGRKTVFVGTGLLAAILVGLALLVPTSPDRPSQPALPSLADCQQALQRQNWSKGAQLCREILNEQPESVPARLMLGQAEFMLGDLSQAVRTLDQLPDTLSPDVISGHLLACDLLLRMGRVEESNQRLQKLQGVSAQARVQRARLLSLTGRFNLAAEVLLTTLQDPLPYQHLYWVAFPETVLNKQAADQLQAWKKAQTPPDSWVLIGLARYALAENRPEEAIQELSSLQTNDPAFPVAQGLLGKAYLDAGQDDELRQWATSRELTSESTSETWNVIAQIALQQDDRPGAIRALLQACQLAPYNQDAVYQLGQLLHQSPLTEEAKRFSTWATNLSRLRALVSGLADNGLEIDDAVEITQLLIQLDRFAEAQAWWGLIQQADPQHSELPKLQQILQQQLVSSSDARIPLVPDSLLEQFPLPSFSAPTAPSNVAHVSPVHFDDRAHEFGLNFRYENGHDPTQTPMLMHEFTGGGVAVLDFDRDGWPELYFPQGGPRPQQQGPLVDELLRNEGGILVRTVTSSARIDERSYSQGAAAGDLNCDGFPDLYVGNIGSNSLWMNNGDGTFSAIETPFDTVTDWTTSCVMTDLTGDGLPDLYDVNYLQGDDVYTRLCQDKEQNVRSCRPTIFEAAPDRFWENSGTGTFVEQSLARGLTAPQGRGLGIVVFRDAPTSTPNIFIANDGEANFFFESVAESPAHFQEAALLNGLAFDAQGKAQACMGIAAGELADTPETALFVTNYYQESNTLYAPNRSGTYDDKTREAQLRSPSLDLLGFGSQFADLNLDGILDLFVANGHEGDYRDLGIPFQMRPQVFLGTPGGKFQESDTSDLGKYFQGQYLGRGAATLDFNRDGRPDVCVTHLDQPAALLINSSTDNGHGLSVWLVGTQSSRDAVGAHVEVSSGTQTWTRQLRAGDGYLSSNQRSLHFGLGSTQVVDSMTISWPSGQVTKYPRPISANGDYIAVEGSTELWAVQP
ncbi:MAG: VCBS repeat-containing protein [Planctomycetaceae bacterium]|nr:VCBS repeat-containing protein [Planctomycetaceae bacterium]